MTTQHESQRWQLDGNSADAYERCLVPQMFAPWADKLIERVELASEKRVLDVGCGTVMRTDTLRGYAAEAGFSSVDVLPIEDDFFRFYRLRS